MIGLIAWEVIWIFSLCWDHSKPLGILVNITMIAIPFIVIGIRKSRHGNSGLADFDKAILNDSDTSDESEFIHNEEHNNFNSSRKSHGEWVKDSIERDQNRGKEYDNMWVEEYLDEHDC